MFEILSLLCIFTAVIVLIILSIIDLKILILPDELNLLLAVCGFAFHFFSGLMFIGYDDMFYGALIGAGTLYVIRFFANRHYDRDTLGLGDVKLLGAGGVWLGPEFIMPAITLGALAGLIHGLAYAAYTAHKTKTAFTVHNLSIPAGPGFAIGIILTGTYIFGPYILETLHDIFA